MIFLRRRHRRDPERQLISDLEERISRLEGKIHELSKLLKVSFIEHWGEIDEAVYYIKTEEKK